MAKSDTTMRMPQQHVRAGRGIPGYKSTDEGKVEVYATKAPKTLSGSTNAPGAARKTKPELQADAEALGIDPEGMTVKELKGAIAQAKSDGD